MFLLVGNKYFNVSQIANVRPFSKPNDPAHWAEIELIDGTRFDGLVLPESLEALSREYFPAPSGYENMSVEFNGDEPDIWRETVVAFAYDPGASELMPITVESGVREAFSVKTPKGTIHCPGVTYPSEENFLAEKLARHKQRSG